MSLGVLILVALEIIIYFGFAERAVNKMGLSKEQLLIFFALMIAGSFFDIPISKSPMITINVGGAIVPIVLVGYILSRTTSKEAFRALIAAVIAGGTIYALTQIYQFEEGHTLIDTNYLFPIVSGVIAYLIGRSRRAAFAAGTLGFLIYDLIHLIRITAGGVPGEADIGGAGALDSIVIGGILAVLLVEVIGESREQIIGSTSSNNGYPDDEVNSLTDKSKQKVEDHNRGENNE